MAKYRLNYIFKTAARTCKGKKLFINFNFYVNNIQYKIISFVS